MASSIFKGMSEVNRSARRWLVFSLLALMFSFSFSNAAEVKSGSNDLVAILKNLKSSDPTVASQAARDLKGRGKEAEQILPALVEALNSPNEVIRLTVIEVLSDMGSYALPILSKCLKDKDPMIREAAALGLFNMSEDVTATIPTLIESLADENKRVREIAVLTLIKTGKTAVPGLIKSLQGENRIVSLAAVEALAGIGKPSVPELVHILKTGDKDSVSMAAKALAQIGEPSVAPLIELLITGDKDAARVAGEILIDIGSPAVPALVEALQRRK